MKRHAGLVLTIHEYNHFKRCPAVSVSLYQKDPHNLPSVMLLVVALMKCLCWRLQKLF